MHTLNFEKRDVQAWSRIFMRYFLLSFLLMCIPLRVMAIGDSGGCGRPTKSIETATFGTPNDMQELLVETMKWQWNTLHPLAQKLIKASDRATAEWRREVIRNFVNAPIGCSSGEWFLDHAVEGGNIEVIKWLLDQGANPNAGLMVPHHSYESIFFRCPHARLDRRPDGLTSDQAIEKTTQAYKFLISKGADINRQLNRGGSFSNGATNALVQCLNDEMIPTLLELGINRSPKNVWNGRAEDEFDDETTRYAPLQEAIWLSLLTR
jgi:hypothetical protein